MRVNRDQKAQAVAELAEEFSEHQTLFVADYRGLDMPASTELRNRLREADAQMRVVKNTLARLAADKAGRAELSEMFVGPTSITFVRGDVAAVAKVLQEVAKQTEILEVRGGVVDGMSVDSSRIKEIAELPPREQILAALVGAIGAPMSQAVGVLAAPTRDIVQVIDARIRQLEEQGES